MGLIIGDGDGAGGLLSAPLLLRFASPPSAASPSAARFADELLAAAGALVSTGGGTLAFF